MPLANPPLCDPSIFYDRISEGYDQLFQSEEALKENEALIRMIDYCEGSVLDIGCGTGLFLDYVSPEVYLGVDSSPGMLRQLIAKHPKAKTVCSSLEDFNPEFQYDLVISLFGAANYSPTKDVLRMQKMGQRSFIMLWADSYTPKMHEGASLKQYHHKDIPGNLIQFNDSYWVVECGS